MTQEVGQSLMLSLNTGLLAIANFIPKFIAGLIILLLGILIASVLKRAVSEIFKALKVDSWLSKYGVPQAKDEFKWTNIISEIVRWFIIIIFLIPTADVWGMPQIVTVLNQFLLYIPNVFVAAIIAVVGFAFARLSHDLVHASTHGLSPETSNSISNVTKWAVNIFVALAVLNQLGVASDMIRILFTGLVAMLAISGGIAFGLGGQSAAKDAVEEVRRKLK